MGVTCMKMAFKPVMWNIKIFRHTFADTNIISVKTGANTAIL